jgi:uncharacterized protein with FMN-binding domain
MKRVLFSITATIVGLVALLSFKTPGHRLSSPGALPAAALPNQPAGNGRAGTPTTSAPPQPGGRSSAAAAGGKFAGAAVQTRYGVVQVQVTVSANRIAAVNFLQLTAYDARSQDINSQAGPILLQETLSAQSARIDTVSGATYTSEGYLQSLQSALDRAGLP